jgi:WD40 repeat protein
LVAALLLAMSLGMAGVLSQWRRAKLNAANEAQQRHRAEAESYTADMNLVLQAWDEGNLVHAQELLWKHVPEPGEPDLRGFEWRYLWNLCRDESRFTITNLPTEQISSVVTSQGHDFVVARGRTGFRLLAGDSGREIGRFVEPNSKRFICSSAFADGPIALSAAGDTDGVVSLWDLETKTVLTSFQAHEKPVLALAFSPDAKLLASTDAADVGGGTVKVWDTRSLKDGSSNANWTNRLAHLCPTLRFSPDGKTLVSAGKEEQDGRLAAWEADTGRELEPFPKEHIGYVETIAFSPEGKLLAASGMQPNIVIWDFAARRVLARLSGHIGAVDSLAFFSDGRRLVSGGLDTTIRIWDVVAKTQINLLRGHTDGVRSVALAPDQASIFSTSGGEVKIWDTAVHPPGQTFETGQSWMGPGISPDGKWLATTEYQGPNTIKVWAFPSCQFKFNLYTLPKNANYPAFSPDGRFLAVGSDDRKIYVWKTASWDQRPSPTEPLIVLTNEFEATGVKFSPDNRILAVVGTVMSPVDEPSHALNRVAFWQVGPWQKVDLAPRAGAADSEASLPTTMEFTKDGRLVIGYKDGWVRFWDLKSGRRLAQFKEHDAPSGYWMGISLSRDGHWLSSWALGYSKVVLHDVRDLRHVVRVDSLNCTHVGWTWEAIFDPEGRTLISSGNDGRVRFWNLVDHDVALTLKHSDGPGGLVGFSPDGNLMLTWDAHGTVKLWPAAPTTAIPRSKPAHKGIRQ